MQLVVQTVGAHAGRPTFAPGLSMILLVLQSRDKPRSGELSEAEAIAC